MEDEKLNRRNSGSLEEADEELDVERKMGHMKFNLCREGENSGFRTLLQAVKRGGGLREYVVSTSRH